MFLSVSVGILSGKFRIAMSCPGTGRGVDIGLIWYGVLRMIDLELAMIAPPVGMPCTGLPQKEGFFAQSDRDGTEGNG